MNITDNPELLATFDEEARERLASLTSGLLALESGPPSRSAIAALFRDAHTIKGSARMMGLTSIVELAHVAEDLLAAVRDRRLTPGRELIDLLLAAVGRHDAQPAGRGPTRSATTTGPRCARRCWPPWPASRVVPLPRSDPAPPKRRRSCQPLSARSEPRSRPSQRVPSWPSRRRSQPVAAPVVAVETVRVAVPRIHDLLNVVGEAEVDARRVERATNELASALATAIARGQHAIPAGSRRCCRRLPRCGSSSRTTRLGSPGCAARR